LQVKDQKNRPLVDACHIIPFAESYNDSVRNGIALSPTFHRAFDKGLLSLTNDYRVILHPQLKDESADFSFNQYRGKFIHLPTNPHFHPSPKSLAYHRQWAGME
jgi:putative restriction endonuclease